MVWTRAPHSLQVALALGASLATACIFDSDEKLRATPDVEDDGGPTVTGPPDTDESTDETTGPIPDLPPAEVTCRDAIDCVVGCAADLQMAELPEPDLSCFLECEEGLTVEEALALLKLGACVSDQCFASGDCEQAVDTEGTTEDTGTDTTETTGIDPEMECINCITSKLLDPQPPGCLEEAAACE